MQISGSIPPGTGSIPPALGSIPAALGSSPLPLGGTSPELGSVPASPGSSAEDTESPSLSLDDQIESHFKMLQKIGVQMEEINFESSWKDKLVGNSSDKSS